MIRLRSEGGVEVKGELMSTQRYFHLARHATARAKDLLDSAEDDKLRYAALELRLAMEALTYDRARVYAEEIPPEEMGTWQPDKVMRLLLEIEPSADSSYTVSFGKEPYPGGTPEKMHVLGTETVFSLAKLRKHYHAVGSLLHMPTMAQVEGDQWPNLATWRERLNAIAEELTKSLNSSVRNFAPGNFNTFPCRRCKKPIRKRVPHDKKTTAAVCFSCGAPYRLEIEDDGEVWWKPEVDKVSCKTAGCDHAFALWHDQIKAGKGWACPKCSKKYRIVYGVCPVSTPDEDQSRT